MKRWTVPAFLLLFYAFPFVFLAMYGDYALGTMAFYLPLTVAWSVLCFFSVRRGQPWVARQPGELSLLPGLPPGHPGGAVGDLL